MRAEILFHVYEGMLQREFIQTKLEATDEESQINCMPLKPRDHPVSFERGH